MAAIGPGNGQAGQIAAEIRALTEAVAALAQRAPRDQTSEAAGAAPEPMRIDAAESLDAALARFSEAIARQAAPTASAMQRSTLTLPSDAQAARGRLDALFGQDGQVVKQDHFFLSVRDIVERYGLPDSIDANDNKLVLTYKSADGRSWQQFATYDGIVTYYGRQGQ